MVLMVNFFTITPCNNGLHIAVQGAAELIELYSKDDQNKERSTLGPIVPKLPLDGVKWNFVSSAQNLVKLKGVL